MPPPAAASPSASAAVSSSGFEPPNAFQVNTIIAACVMIFLSGLFWNFPVLRHAIAGIKLLVVATHELFHLFAGIAFGGSLVSISIDPNTGGFTAFTGLMRTKPRIPHVPPASVAPPARYGELHWSVRAMGTLIMGYFGSSLVGFLYIFCAFDIVASKIASFTIAFGLLVPLVRADTVLPFVSVFVLEIILVGMWFVAHGSGLRFYVLWVGVFNLFYPVWDYVDETVFDKPNTSDCTQYAAMSGVPAAVFFAMWTVFDCLVFVAALFAGIIVFHKTPDEMYRSAAAFLPT